MQNGLSTFKMFFENFQKPNFSPNTILMLQVLSKSTFKWTLINFYFILFCFFYLVILLNLYNLMSNFYAFYWINSIRWFSFMNFFFSLKKKKTLDFRVDTGFITLWVQAQPPHPICNLLSLVKSRPKRRRCTRNTILRLASGLFFLNIKL